MLKLRHLSLLVFLLLTTASGAFGISTTIFVIMAALMVPSTILALQFLRRNV
ncbi:MAG: hypothetical protein IPN95_08500 [Bacteroidetes bacterium]|nr:hypothetical protein [Bacteroidota bacterium]